MGSEEWVTDVKKAQDIIAKAVSQYTEEQDAEGNDIKFHRAYHGSPHDHNKFDSSKIGTGEGAQAYGYGHYFADSKDVAEYYRNILNSKWLVDGVPLVDAQGVPSLAKSAINLRQSTGEAISYLESDPNYGKDTVDGRNLKYAIDWIRNNLNRT